MNTVPVDQRVAVGRLKPRASKALSYWQPLVWQDRGTVTYQHFIIEFRLFCFTQAYHIRAYSAEHTWNWYVPRIMVHAQRKMGFNYDAKVLVWEKSVEENEYAVKLLEEVQAKQLPPFEDDDMHIERLVHLGKDILQKDYNITTTAHSSTVKLFLERSLQIYKAKQVSLEVSCLTEDDLNRH